MPTLDVSQSYLEKLLISDEKSAFDVEKFEELCFDFGVELDKIDVDEKTKAVSLKIDIHANRPDLLCPEALAMNLNIYNEKIKPTVFKLLKPAASENLKFIVDESVKEVRPFVCAAVLKGVSFTEESFKSFINYQEKLHCTLAKDRSLSSIGTHDLDTTKGPFTYKALEPENIIFTALKQTKQMNAVELFEELSKDLHLRKYLRLLENHPKYPVIVDSENNVLSLPPIINGTLTQMSHLTKNVLVEVTGTDLPRVLATMRCVLSGYSCYCENKFTAYECEIEGRNYESSLSDFASKEFTLDLDEICSTIGTKMDADHVEKCLNKMGIIPKVENSKFTVKAPLNRTDIMHEIDLIEDIAIGHNINKIDYSVPELATYGSLQKLTSITNKMRNELAQNNLTEALTFSLCSKDDISVNFNENWDTHGKNSAVTIENPKTSEFQAIRMSLLPGLMKTLATNQRSKLPISIFEISDVVNKDEASCVGAKNTRNLAILIADKKTYFENLHGILDRIMISLNIPFHKQTGYSLTPLTDDTYLSKGFISNMATVINYRETPVGLFGIVCPTVNEKYDIKVPCVALELSLEKLLSKAGIL